MLGVALAEGTRLALAQRAVLLRRSCRTEALAIMHCRLSHRSLAAATVALGRCRLQRGCHSRAMRRASVRCVAPSAALALWHRRNGSASPAPAAGRGIHAPCTTCSGLQLAPDRTSRSSGSSRPHRPQSMSCRPARPPLWPTRRPAGSDPAYCRRRQVPAVYKWVARRVSRDPSRYSFPCRFSLCKRGGRPPSKVEANEGRAVLCRLPCPSHHSLQYAGPRLRGSAGADTARSVLRRLVPPRARPEPATVGPQPWTPRHHQPPGQRGGGFRDVSKLGGLRGTVRG